MMTEEVHAVTTALEYATLVAKIQKTEAFVSVMEDEKGEANYYVGEVQFPTGRKLCRVQSDGSIVWG